MNNAAQQVRGSLALQNVRPRTSNYEKTVSRDPARAG
jgi:hypothetical protein